MYAAYLWNYQGNIPRVDGWTFSTIASHQSVTMASQADPVTRGREGGKQKRKGRNKKL
jgi:hypothetical protein